MHKATHLSGAVVAVLRLERGPKNPPLTNVRRETRLGSMPRHRLRLCFLPEGAHALAEKAPASLVAWPRTQAFLVNSQHCTGSDRAEQL
jgi:hypothetical protein